MSFGKWVNLIYIRDIQGHSLVTTTEIYSKANSEIKREHILKASKKIYIEVDYSEKKKKKRAIRMVKNSI